MVALVGEQADLYAADAAVELSLQHLKVRIGGPGEVMYVFGVKLDRLGAIPVVGVAGLHAGRADDVVLGQSDLDVVGPKVGEELGHGVELVAVPCTVPEDSDFGEPLACEQESALVPSSSQDLREGGAELDFESDVLAGLDGPRQCNFHHSLVVSVTVIRRGELDLLGQVAHANHFQRDHVVGATALVIPGLTKSAAAEIAI